MNKRPLNTITPLLCITIRLENYVELRIHDEYTTPIFQYRFEQHFANPWKEPKKSIKTKLILTYTSLILKNASWWPYRVEHSIKYKSVQKLITFNQGQLRFAIGLYDEDYAEKEFVVMSIKNAYDMERLIQLIDSQLLIWKYALNKETDYSIRPDKKQLMIGYKESTPLNKISKRRGLIGKSQNAIIKNDAAMLNSLANNTSSNQSNVKLTNNPHRTLEIDQNHSRRYSQQTNQDYNEYKPTLQIYTNVDSNDSFNHRRLIEPVQSTSYSSRYDTERQKKQLRKEKERTRKIKNQQCQTDNVYIENNTKSWEVDIKHVRYDPIQGNIIDDNGSVYLYTAHEID
ncbi:unnamed protein product [Schistosoma turkestanicum]|nr:unnamed protein product [Schistosoma turkestanicum]CAH8497533.1 unnamed protein product [Schistosoma turkestanicum]